MDPTTQAILDLCTAHRDPFTLACHIHGRDPEEVRAQLAPGQLPISPWLKALTSLSLGVVIADEQGTLLDWNDTARRLMGYDDAPLGPLEDLRPHFELRYQGEKLDYADWPMPRMIRGEVVQSLELDVRRTDINRQWTVRFHGVLVHEGGRDLIVLFHDDRTAEAQAQRELSESHDLLQAVTENATDAVFVKDREGRYLLCNGAAAAFIGKTKDHILGQDDMALFEDADQLMEYDRGIMDKGDPVTAEETLSSDGVTRTYLSSKAPYRNAEGEVIGLVGIARDITERKRTEESLRKSEARFRELADAMPQIVWTTTPEGRLEYYNQRLGNPPVHPMNLTHPDERDELQKVWQQHLKEGTPLQLEHRMRTLDGDYRWYVHREEPSRDAEGKILRWYATATDIHDFKQLEMQMAQTQKMEAVGRLAGGVAHDFNNMLTVINGNCDLLMKEFPQHPLLEAVRDAGGRSARLTAQLLSFSRQAAIAPRPLDLNELLREAERLLQRLLGEDLQLHLDLTAVPCIKADRGQLDQVLMNLAVNARDAMPRGGQLTFRTRLVDGQVELTVKDTGTGIPPEVLDKIFEPFFTTKPAGEGTGLGLSVVHGAVRQLGGSLSVASEVGRGTTFTILIPPSQEVPVAPKADAPQPEVRAATVLLVEDESAVRKLLGRILTTHGYKVLSAGGGEEALQHDTEGVDLLLVDVVMPGMNGPQVADAIRARRPNLPVLFMSGYTDDALIQRGLETNVLQKPFGPQELLQRIAETI